MSYILSFDLNLGIPGLTLQAQLVDTTGATVGGPVTTGFVEVGNGFYLFTHSTIPDGHRGGITFQDSGGGGPFRGFQSVNPEEAENVDAKVTTRATPAQVNTQVDLVLNTAIPGSPTADSVYERVQTLDNNYTAARAGNLDNLDAAVTSRSTHTAAAVWEVALEAAITAKEMMRVGLAALAGEAEDLNINAPKYKDIAGGTKVRISASTDDFGNRTSVVLDFS